MSLSDDVQKTQHWCTGTKDCLHCEVVERIREWERMHQFVTIRPEVIWFAARMEERLVANHDKGGWRECGDLYLVERLKEEVDELIRELACVGLDLKTKIVHEAADVAYFAMMIADKGKS